QTLMRRDVFSRRQNRKDGAAHPRNGFHYTRGLRALDAIAFDFVIVTVKKKPLPFSAARHRFSICPEVTIFRYVFNVRNTILVQHHSIELLPDCLPVRFKSWNPRKAFFLQKWAIGIVRKEGHQLVHNESNESKHVVPCSSRD